MHPSGMVYNDNYDTQGDDDDIKGGFKYAKHPSKLDR